MKCSIDYETIRHDVRIAMAHNHPQIGHQNQLAVKAGVSTASLSRFLAGKALDTEGLLSVLSVAGLELEQYVLESH